LNVEVLTDFQPVNAVGDLAVLARLLHSWTEIGVPQRDAVSIPAGGIDNLTAWDGTVGVDPVALPPTVCGGRIGDVFTVAASLCRSESSHSEPMRIGSALVVDSSKSRSQADYRAIWSLHTDQVGWTFPMFKTALPRPK
jgi:hypothetical protein